MSRASFAIPNPICVLTMMYVIYGADVGYFFFLVVSYGGLRTRTDIMFLFIKGFYTFIRASLVLFLLHWDYVNPLTKGYMQNMFRMFVY